jgi:hypothetical protein
MAATVNKNKNLKYILKTNPNLEALGRWRPCTIAQLARAQGRPCYHLAELYYMELSKNR